MSKTLVVDEVGNAVRKRDNLIRNIDDTLAKMQVSFEKWQRHYFYALGEMFTRLRAMLPDPGYKGDVDFRRLCAKHWPKLHKRSRQRYMVYYEELSKKLGRPRGVPRDLELPVLIKTISPKTYRSDQQRNKARLTYKRILDEEYQDPAHFQIKRSAKEVENDLVSELAGKIISTGYRTLSIKMHPDRKGGTNEAQRRLNAAKEMLDQMLERAPLFLES